MKKLSKKMMKFLKEQGVKKKKEKKFPEVSIKSTIKGKNPQFFVLGQDTTLTYPDFYAEGTFTYPDGTVKRGMIKTELKIEVLGFYNV